MLQKHLLFGLIVLTLFQCKQRGTETNSRHVSIINIPNLLEENKKRSYLIDDFEYVKLETGNNCLVGEIKKVEVIDDKIVILTSLQQSEVLVFDKQGRYITKIMKGRGPNELIYPTDISVNVKSKQIFVLDGYQTIKQFNLEGVCTSSIVLKERGFFLSHIGGNFLLFEPNMIESTDKLLTFVSGNESEKKMIDKHYTGQQYIEPSVFTYDIDGTVYINSVFSDTIYAFSSGDQSIHAAYSFDFEGREANRVSRLNGITDFRTYLNNIEDKNWFAGVSNFHYSDNQLFFSIREGKNTFYCRYATEDNVFIYSDKLFESLPNNYVRSGTTDGYSIFAYDAPWLIDYFAEHETHTQKVQDIKSSLSEYDNPVIIFAAI